MSQGDLPTRTEASLADASLAAPTTHVAPSPHLSETAFTTRRMMIDVLIGLAPVLAVALLVFRWYAVVQVGLSVLTCLAAEAVFTWMRRKPAPIGDCSAAVTGVILGLSLPWSAPWYVPVIGSVVAIGLGKVVCGGLGYNIFNPAMVGRAFVMLSFAREMGASAYVALQSD
ncbi:MAG: RnfABCDGE type electron transport complex subunit D, partial [Planctomycetes bacterium]|nr:RnfABCDGE type electron transport complex subunit D [Planctomycetota bacterium]